MNRSRTLTASAALLLALTFVLQTLAARHHSFALLTAQLGLLIATLGVFPTGILARLFRPGPVTLHRILGAVGAYLLVGLMWALGYLALQLDIPGAVQFQADRGGPPHLGLVYLLQFWDPHLGRLWSGHGRQLGCAVTGLDPVACRAVLPADSHW